MNSKKFISFPILIAALALMVFTGIGIQSASANDSGIKVDTTTSLRTTLGERDDDDHDDDRGGMDNRKGSDDNDNVRDDDRGHDDDLRNDRDDDEEDDDDEDNDSHRGIVGTVTAISGSTITITRNGDNAIYTINAANAKISHGMTVLALADIKVGDMIIVKGTVTGSTVAATEIKNPKYGDKIPENDKGNNLKPGITGTVTAISGSTIMVTGKNNILYTVDTANAKFQMGKGTIITITDIKVGDTVMIQGAVNGTSVVAKNVFDIQLFASTFENEESGRFFKALEKFFKNLFGRNR